MNNGEGHWPLDCYFGKRVIKESRVCAVKIHGKSIKGYELQLARKCNVREGQWNYT